MSNCLSFNWNQLQRFLCRSANEALQKTTGVDILDNYNDVRYSAGQFGLNVHPDYAVNEQINKVGDQVTGRFSGSKISTTKSIKLVSTVDEFIALRDSIAKTPSGGAVCLVHALLNYAIPSNRTLGSQLLVLAVAEERLVKGTTYKGYALNEDLAGYLSGALEAENGEEMLKTALSSLVVGTNSQMGYTFDTNKVSLAEDVGAETGQDLKSGHYTVHLWSTGSDGPRRVDMSINKNGIWKAKDFGSLLGQVAAPPVTLSAADDL